MNQKDAFTFLSEEEKIEQTEDSVETIHFLKDSWRRLKKNRVAVISMVLIFLISAVSIASIWISPHDPAKQNVMYTNLPPKIPGCKINGLNGTAMSYGERVDMYELYGVPEDVCFYLGTDGLGRDVLSRLLAGTRISLLIALIAALFDLVIGVAYGLISGMASSRVDSIMQRVIEILSGIPNLVVMVLMLVIFDPGILSIVLAMAITNWISMARIVRAQTMKIREQEYVLTAVTMGESKIKIAVKHILPNISGVIIVQLMFSIPTAIFFEAFLSFIGLGIRPPLASLGTMLNDGYKTFQFLPYLMWIPAVVLSVLMICFNLLADGLRDAFDPKMKD